MTLFVCLRFWGLVSFAIFSQIMGICACYDMISFFQLCELLGSEVEVVWVKAATVKVSLGKNWEVTSQAEAVDFTNFHLGLFC